MLATTARPAGETSEAAYAKACARLEAVKEALRRPLEATPERAYQAAAEFESPTTREAFGELVERAKRYVEAGDVFQVVPSHRFSAAFKDDPFALYRSLRRMNHFTVPVLPEFRRLPVGGVQPGNPGASARRQRSPSAPGRHAPAGRDAVEEDLALERELLADPKERAEHLMLLDLGRNDVGRVAMLKRAGANEPQNVRRGPSVRVTESFTVERYSHVMHIVSNVEGDAPEGLEFGRRADGRPVSPARSPARRK